MMRRIVILRRRALLGGLLGAVVAVGIAGLGQAAPTGHPATATGTHQGKQLQAQLKDLDAKISDARARHGQLEAQVTQLEQQNADRQKRMQQRDGEIAALQEQLQAAGMAAPARSADH